MQSVSSSSLLWPAPSAPHSCLLWLASSSNATAASKRDTPQRQRPTSIRQATWVEYHLKISLGDWVRAGNRHSSKGAFCATYCTPASLSLPDDLRYPTHLQKRFSTMNFERRRIGNLLYILVQTYRLLIRSYCSAHLRRGSRRLHLNRGQNGENAGGIQQS